MSNTLGLHDRTGNPRKQRILHLERGSALAIFKGIHGHGYYVQSGQGQTSNPNGNRVKGFVLMEKDV
jgi:hypothetical protein